MADKGKDWDSFDETRMELAVAEIAKSENLRFFMRVLFSVTGLGDTPIGENALKTATAVGRHSIGTDLVSLLNQSDPSLYPNLLLEENKEQLARGNNDVY